MVGAKHIGKLVAKERKKLLRRCASKTTYPMESEGLDEEEEPRKIEQLFFGEEHDFGLEAPTEPEQALTFTQGSQPQDQVVELTKRVRALEKKLEANTNILEANTRELAESTLQVSKLTSLLQIFLKGKSKDLEVSFPISDEDALAALELKINPTTKLAYIQVITDLLKLRTLPKSIKSVLAEPFICDFNIDGLNGKKSLRAFPEFFSVLIDSITMLEVQQPPEKALAHAMYCVKNNAHKKRYTQMSKNK